eukprot:11991152-Prorocentrum_lima.AAC.1
MSMGYDGGDYAMGGMHDSAAPAASNCFQGHGQFSEAQPTQTMFTQHHDAGYPQSVWNQGRTPQPTQSFMSHPGVPPG